MGNKVKEYRITLISEIGDSAITIKTMRMDKHLKRRKSGNYPKVQRCEQKCDIKMEWTIISQCEAKIS